jgi:hypothetical protein
MNLRNIGAAAGLALAMSTAVAAQQAAAVGATPVAVDGKELTLVGCVVKGEGGYVLSGSGPGFTVETTRTTVDSGGVTTTTTTTRTTGAPAIPAADQRIIYWLDDDDNELEEHAGQRVEVKGKVEGDVDRGEIEVERENNMIELEIKAKGDKITIKLPDTPAANQGAVGTSGMVTDRPQDIPFLVRKLDVKSVKRIADSCM